MSRVALIVAAQDEARPSNLDAFAAEARSAGGRLIVVDGTRAGLEPIASARMIRSDPRSLAPELWRDGLLAADEPFAAFSSGTMRPRPGYLSALVARMESSDLTGVGGRILPAASLAALDGAVYLARYLPYADPQPGTSPAGENAIYRRAALDRCREVWSDGFWESEVHARLKKAAPATKFGLEPNAVLEYSGGATWGPTLMRRFRHGRRYGAGRGKARWWALAGPAVPALLGVRVAATLRRVGLPPGIKPAAAPAWMAVTTAWSLGESIGLATRPAAPRFARINGFDTSE